MLVFSFGTFFLGAIPSVSAQTTGAQTQLETVGGQTGVSTSVDLPTMIGRIIYIALSFMGVILLAILLYAGYEWMTAGGDPKKVEEAKNRIRNAIIGLIIIASSYAITAFIMRWLTTITEQPGGITGQGTGGVGFPTSAGSLGSGIIEYHVPSRDATGVPRNTSIIVTFKEPIKLSTIIAGYNDNGTPADVTDDPAPASTALNTNTVKIFPTADRTGALVGSAVRVRFTADRKTFVFKPVDFLGNPTVNTGYTVELLPTLQREDGLSAFTGEFSSGYKWSFEVSTVVDKTPPQITSVIPVANNLYAPNIIIQINFNEAIDPTSAAGIWTGSAGFPNIQVQATPAVGAATRPAGEFKVSNHYQTVEFMPAQDCGVLNSCGRRVFCLPTNSAINVLARAATLSTTPPEAVLLSSGYDGIVDVAGNSLDGNRDGRAQGPVAVAPAPAIADNYAWTFNTSLTPNLSAPLVVSTVPGPSANNIPVDQSPSARFGGSEPGNGVLQASTVVSNNVYIVKNEAGNDTFWFTPFQSIVTQAGTIATDQDRDIFGNVAIGHRLYTQVTEQSRTNPPMYYPIFSSDIQNVYQNCFKPASSNTCAGSPNCCDERPGSGTSCGYPETRP